MKKKVLSSFIGLVLVLVAVNVVLAANGNKWGRAKTPPFPQPAEKDLKKVVFIRYAPGKEPVCDNDDVCEKRENWKKCPNDCKKKDEEPKESACYDFLSGAKPKWDWVENYSSEVDLGSVSVWATGVWNGATSATIFGDDQSGAYPWGVYDYINAISYGDYSEANVIAVTAIWFRGKTIYEYDIMFDNDYFPNKDIDLDTVALHEFGHGAGLGDHYKSVCSDEVMYGYYEREKRSLGDGDITGIRTLYGE